MNPAMANRIRAVLLVPTDRKLLANGPCGERPPCAVLQRRSAVKHEECHDCDSGPHTGPDGDWTTHCALTTCLEPWPCEEAGAVVQPAFEFWAPWNGEHWSVPDALALAWADEPVLAGIDRLIRAMMQMKAFQRGPGQSPHGITYEVLVRYGFLGVSPYSGVYRPTHCAAEMLYKAGMLSREVEDTLRSIEIPQRDDPLTDAWLFGVVAEHTGLGKLVVLFQDPTTKTEG